MPKVWWSAVKKSVQSHFYKPLQKRVQLHRTLYRGSHNGCQMDTGAGRFWILLDGEQIFSASDKEFWNEVQALMDNLCCANESQRSGDKGWYAARNQAMPIVRSRGIYSHYDCYDGLKEYLNLSIEDALQSPNNLIKALALLDEQVGKRRLRAIHIEETEHELVKCFYRLRCEAELLKS